MMLTRTRNWLRVAALSSAAGIAALAATPALAGNFENDFDQALGTELRAPKVYTPPSYNTPLERQIAMLADGSQGRIGVAAMDLRSGQALSVLGDQRFPMASTSKIAIAATFLDGVDRGRWSLDDRYAMLLPVPSQPLSSTRAPVRNGPVLSARELIELMLTRSSNSATDAMIRAVGGTGAVNDWVRRAGIRDFELTRDIATLVRDDGKLDPATVIDTRDSATPNAMLTLLSGIYQGRWLSASSQSVLIGAMSRCITGKSRIRGLLPQEAQVAHKTGTLHNTASDVGIITLPDGRAIALAIYVTGQGSKPNRDARIASIARAIYYGYHDADRQLAANGDYPRAGNY